MVERVNRTVLSTIVTGIQDPRRKDWDLKIKEVERDLNNAMNKTTNKTPFETLHGYSPRFHDGILRRLADEDMDPWTEPERIQESVRTQIENKQEIMKTYYDKKKCRTLQFEVGKIVVMRHVPKMTGEPTKAQPKYRGPLINHRGSTKRHVQSDSVKRKKREEEDSATEESPNEESEEVDTLRRNPRRSCNARFNRGRLKSRNGRIVRQKRPGLIHVVQAMIIMEGVGGMRSAVLGCPIHAQWDIGLGIELANSSEQLHGFGEKGRPHQPYVDGQRSLPKDVECCVTAQEDSSPDHKTLASWSLGRITKVSPGADGIVRVVELQTEKQHHLIRPISKIALLPF
ncbi:hypothetical protein LAZ67_2002677 [Cordylochernes scorpioides]|uniref:DUF5641 domain-containing protein n=1 Tax=Cordylochernes scorpioides TaxID=51811 RepID=A0ABY6K260_9ARAC|nr:hypothetical protein LAZ67_2002677 [Cordylochernes scorpioides]